MRPSSRKGGTFTVLPSEKNAPSATSLAQRQMVADTGQRELRSSMVRNCHGRGSVARLVLFGRTRFMQSNGFFVQRIEEPAPVTRQNPGPHDAIERVDVPRKSFGRKIV